MDMHSAQQRHIEIDAPQRHHCADSFHKSSRPAPFRKRAAIAVLALAGSAVLMSAAFSTSTAQDPRGKLVSITSESTPYGMSMFRLWSNGDIEVMVLGQDNVWSDWKAVASGKGGYAPGGKPGE